MYSLLEEIHLVILNKLDPLSARMYGETCKDNKKLILENVECSCSNCNVCKDAVNYGHLKVIKFLRHTDRFWSQYGCSLAIECGQLEILEYLHKNGFYWTQHICMMLAAKNGHLKVLKCLHENGCPRDKNICYYSHHYNRSDILCWLKESGNCRCGGEYH
jgi:hypothetical protein